MTRRRSQIKAARNRTKARRRAIVEARAQANFQEALPKITQAINAAYDEALDYAIEAESGSSWALGRMIFALMPPPEVSADLAFSNRRIEEAMEHLVETGVFERRMDDLSRVYYRRRSPLEQLAAQAE